MRIRSSSRALTADVVVNGVIVQMRVPRGPELSAAVAPLEEYLTNLAREQVGNAFAEEEIRARVDARLREHIASENDRLARNHTIRVKKLVDELRSEAFKGASASEFADKLYSLVPLEGDA
jgi:hypothetical protein